MSSKILYLRLKNVYRTPVRCVCKGFRFQEKFAYAGVCPGFTEKLRMGAAAAVLSNSNTSSILRSLYERVFYEHVFDKKGSAGGYTRVLSCRPKAK